MVLMNINIKKIIAFSFEQKTKIKNNLFPVTFC